MTDQIAGLIEFEDLRGRDAAAGGRIEYRALFVIAERIGASMSDPDVIPRVDGDAGHGTEDPMIRQRFGPQRINFEYGRLDSAAPLSVRRLLERVLTGSERDEDEGRANIKTSLHIAHFRLSFQTQAAWPRFAFCRPRFLMVQLRSSFEWPQYTRFDFHITIRGPVIIYSQYIRSKEQGEGDSC